MIVIDRVICDYCGTCVAVCQPDAIFLTEKDIVIDPDRCTLCGNCVVVCPLGALRSAENEN